ncbi:Tetratricopeptide repeat-containing protein [Alteromonadaceae bacterium Bs31]|nr:Tetratricopeptide repeat-containing protein [Alteromonadaceae bacterium Bs31]
MQDPIGALLPEPGIRVAKRNRGIKGIRALNVILSLVLLLAQATSWAKAEKNEQEDQYQQVLIQSFHSLAKAKIHSKYLVDSLSALRRNTEIALESENHVSAILQLEVNRAQLRENIYEPEVASIFSYMLDQQAFALADELFEWALEDGDTDTISRMHYYLAHYYYQLGNWDKAATHLSAIDNKNALTADQGDYATIIFGVTLQNKKKHRAAVKFYDEIKPESPYYVYAQLNRAIAFIRQGWWTDAKIAIDTALKADSSKPSEEFENRLHLVLGYSQLQHEFYRNGRDSFRRITVDSQYADRALLGIGLCALNQGDYAGALNAFNILKNQNKNHISVSEAYLLFAFTHEQMHQTTLASAHYEEAIAYYNGKIRLIDQSLKALENTKVGLSAEIENRLEKHTLALPKYLQLRLRNLEFLHSTIEDAKLKNAIVSAQNQLNQEAKDYLLTQLKSDRGILVSYLSQAQFGQTKLFDTQQ